MTVMQIEAGDPELVILHSKNLMDMTHQSRNSMASYVDALCLYVAKF